MNDLVALGQVVRSLRLERQLTQEALAERAHLHHNYVSLVERGLTSPALDSLRAIADALSVRPWELLFWMEEWDTSTPPVRGRAARSSS